MPLTIRSPAFPSNDPIPKQYSGEGIDISPALEWSDAPKGTQEFALICDDPDAPVPEPWVHWVIYQIPGTVTKLPEGIPKTDTLKLPPGAVQGTNSWNKIGYGGPMPPPGHGWHRYFFKLYALDNTLSLKSGASKEELLSAMQGHIMAEADFVGKYKR